MAELATYDFDWHPAGWEAIDHDDVFAWQWPNDWHADSRGVARATFDDRHVDARIDELRGFFARHGRTARWHVGPSTRSRVLVEMLHARAGGVFEPRLMTADLDHVRFHPNSDVRVVEVTARDVVEPWLAACFSFLDEQGLRDEVDRRMRYLSSPRRGGDLVAYLDGALVGSASWRDASDGRAVQFVGAWTATSARGRGVYGTLCTYRAQRARERGIRYATIVADPRTSAPIVAKAGFIDHGPDLVFTEVRL